METQHQENTTPPPSSASSPSPSHEFTFAISLDPTAAKIPDNKSKSSSSHQQTSSAAIDLSPADDIFFHGHLLPLRHLTSDALPLVSPRSSTNSLDSFTLPVKDQLHHHRHHRQQACSFQEERRGCLLQERKGTVKEKSKSFSLFWNRKKVPSQSNDDDCRGQKRKSKFEILKGYFRLFKPFDSLRNSGKSNSNNKNSNINNSRPYSLSSGKLLQVRSRGESRARHRGDLFSAPASMKASPTNSGRLNLATSSGTISPINTKNDSTMEELQAAIQAAIAHCKKSIAASTEDAIISCE